MSSQVPINTPETETYHPSLNKLICMKQLTFRNFVIMQLIAK
jgi:hypothetical protein